MENKTAREDARPTKFEFVPIKFAHEGREGREGFLWTKFFGRSNVNL